VNQKLRDVFGRSGDFSSELANMFGHAYLDHPDDTQSDDLGLRAAGLPVYHINGLLERALASAPEISCRANQQILSNHLRAVRSREHIGQRMDWDQNFANNRHMEFCHNRRCQILHRKAIVEDR